MGRDGLAGRRGFVLAGGRSTRMGRDKALLPSGPRTLLEQIAAAVRDAAGSVTLIGSPERYAFLGFPVLADAVAGQGPLGGVYTALEAASLGAPGAAWNLIVACDMPGLTAGFLESLLDAAELAGKDCLAPVTARGVEPLCAVYHTRVAAAAKRALHHKLLKMQDFLKTIDTAEWPVADSGVLKNVNTPEEWLAGEYKP